MRRRHRHLIAIATMPLKGWTREDPATGTGASGGGAPSTTDTTSTDDSATGEDSTPAEGKAPKITGEFDPDRAARSLAAARAAEDKAKNALKAEKDRVAAILKAAGLTADGKEDPEAKLKELADRTAAAEAKAAQLTTREAVRTAASKHAADAELLLDSNAFAGKLAKLDHTADDYSDKVADLVKAEVKANPRYGAVKAATGGRGVDHSGGTGTRPQGLGAAIAARMSK